MISIRLPPAMHADRYLLKVFRRARSRFHLEKIRINDKRSESGVFTSSSITTFTDDEIDSNIYPDYDEDDLQSIVTDDADGELLCQSLEVVLMETLRELRQYRTRMNSNHINPSIKDDEQVVEVQF